MFLLICDRLGLTLNRNSIYQFTVSLLVNQQRSIQNQESYIILEGKHVMSLVLSPPLGPLSAITMQIAPFPALNGGIYSIQKRRYGIETTTLRPLAAIFLQRDST